MWGRPPIPSELAEVVVTTLDKWRIGRVGVVGSMSPSVLTTLAYTETPPRREVSGFAPEGFWDDLVAWNYGLDELDTNSDEELQALSTSRFLPFNSIDIWDGATPFFESEALFIDLPFSHRCVRLDAKWLERRPHPVIFLGFLERHEGPADILAWVTQKGYTVESHTATIRNGEKRRKLKYTLCVATLRDLESVPKTS